VFNKKCLKSKWDKAIKPDFLFRLKSIEQNQEIYNKANKYDQKLLIKLPNFNKKIFKEITGIDVVHNK
jgi:hypothetical protein